ncbi:Enamine deaminase RidA, house cleaning of reactive enamine intermediates, YjgF/YER057c/UK114 family [Sphingomonas laterariae]|uniref:Enamine deaminase RidA, house cleaning of reactive enamine intermediates, YjgF/YER057c/UK114 family n=1 Tax=Edaphosphingomonas laterariae TaxID=861865 RepID=A0A239EC70_9SPHN|nr:RidA family protein [Sphingomonas laterariae]SNS41544.1 Enamine deaminase RidA, house cleaning of reactive enamine intermediates, YjgF/YER057c/UK114 family [Sphingomonas laterariae]
MRTLQPAGWPRPKGYSNGIEASGRTIFVAGQIGWDETETFHAKDFAGQFEQALRNILAVLAEAEAGPEHIVRLTWFITDKQAYLADARRVGEIYRTVMGRNYPVMSVVEVRALMEDEALVEIEATAVLP